MDGGLRGGTSARDRRGRGRALRRVGAALARPLPPRHVLAARLAASRDTVVLNASRIVRLTAAAVLAYLAAKAITPNLTDLTGPLTALLVVQASLFGSLRSGLGRVASVLTGVVVALGLSIWCGLTWWSLGLAIATALTLAYTMRLGDHILETPISAMLVLGVTQHDAAAETRILNTLVGAGVGMAFNLLVPPSVQGQDTVSAVRAVARDLADALDTAAGDLERGFARSRVHGWLDDVHRVLPRLAEAEEAVALHAERRRFNPRSVASDDAGPLLRSGLHALDTATLAVRHTLVSLAEQAPQDPPEAESPRTGPLRIVDSVRAAAAGRDAGAHSGHDEATDPLAEAAAAQEEALRGALGSVLALMGESVSGYGDFVTARAAGTSTQAAEAFETGVESLRETRAMLTELLFVEATDDSAGWLLHGSILGGIDRFLDALDLEPLVERAPRPREPLTRRLLPAGVPAVRVPTRSKGRRDEIAADLRPRPRGLGERRYPST